MSTRNKIPNFTALTKYQMPVGIFVQVKTDKKCVKFCVKIPSGCSENNEQL